MNFGTGYKNDYERVKRNMHENSQRDPIPSMRSICGSDEKVMNLRPLDKTKHLNKKPFAHKGRNQAERI